MDLPRCKNPDCPRSQTKLLEETDSNWQFACVNCHTMWVVSKPAAMAHGRAQAYKNKLEAASRAERERLLRKKFGPPSKGWLEINA